MKKHFFFLALLGLGLTSCDVGSKRDYDKNSDGRNGAAMENISESAADTSISEAIRAALKKNPSLSEDAKNIKVMTIQGQVKLNGRVKDDMEKIIIVDEAKKTVGVISVEDLTETPKNAKP